MSSPTNGQKTITEEVTPTSPETSTSTARTSSNSSSTTANSKIVYWRCRNCNKFIEATADNTDKICRTSCFRIVVQVTEQTAKLERLQSLYDSLPRKPRIATFTKRNNTSGKNVVDQIGFKAALAKFNRIVRSTLKWTDGGQVFSTKQMNAFLTGIGLQVCSGNGNLETRLQAIKDKAFTIVPTVKLISINSGTPIPRLPLYHWNRISLVALCKVLGIKEVTKTTIGLINTYYSGEDLRERCCKLVVASGFDFINGVWPNVDEDGTKSSSSSSSSSSSTKGTSVKRKRAITIDQAQIGGSKISKKENTNDAASTTNVSHEAGLRNIKASMRSKGSNRNQETRQIVKKVFQLENATGTASSLLYIEGLFENATSTEPYQVRLVSKTEFDATRTLNTLRFLLENHKNPDKVVHISSQDIANNITDTQDLQVKTRKKLVPLKVHTSEVLILEDDLFD